MPRALTGAALAVLALVAGCNPLPPLRSGSGSEPGIPAGPALQAAGPYRPEASRHEGGTITVGGWEFPPAVAPIYSTTPGSITIEAALFSGLLGLDSSGAWYPDLAAEVPTVENGAVRLADGGGMVVTYRMRRGLRWSDGVELTAADVAFTWRAVTGAPAFNAALAEGWGAIVGVTAPDPETAVVTFRTIYPAYRVLFGAILPRHRLGGVDSAALPRDPYWTAPDVVSGPFAYDSRRGDTLNLRRNPHHADGRTGADLLGETAHLDRLAFRSYPTKQAMLAGARSGEVDLALGLNERDLDNLSASPAQRLAYLPAMQYEQVSFNQQDPNPATGLAPPWAGDPGLLSALVLAVDREAIRSGPLHGRAPPAATPINPLLAWAHDASVVAAAGGGAEARRLLAADGWLPGSDGIRARAGRRLAFTLTTTADSQLRAQEELLLVRGWRAVGAEVTIKNATTEALFGSYASGGVLARGRFEAGLWAWISPPDPDGEFAILHSSRVPAAAGGGQNYSRCHDAGIDRALEAGRATLDQARRGAAYRDFERAFLAAGCEVPLYQRLDIAVVSNRLHNLVLNPTNAGNTWNVADWWVG